MGHERLLAAELHKLDAKFTAWKAGEIDAFELNEFIHAHNNGTSRELWVRFTSRGLKDVVVAGLVVHGVIQEAELSAALLEALKSEIHSVKSWRDPNSFDCDS